jgi:hypothetical protein
LEGAPDGAAGLGLSGSRQQRWTCRCVREVVTAAHKQYTARCMHPCPGWQHHCRGELTLRALRE